MQLEVFLSIYPDLKYIKYMKQNPENTPKHVVLVGTGGAGKTSIGRLLASGLGVEFIDSDEVIIDREQSGIADIFANKGESYFRDLERQVIQELIASQTPYLIGTGGGAFMNDQTRTLIQETALSLFLKADIEVLLKRIGDGEGRPLYEGQDTRGVLEDLIGARYPVYAEADLTVETYDEPIEETLARVTDTLYTHLKPQ